MHILLTEAKGYLHSVFFSSNIRLIQKTFWILDLTFQWIFWKVFLQKRILFFNNMTISSWILQQQSYEKTEGIVPKTVHWCPLDSEELWKSANLCQEDIIKQQLGLSLIFGDIGVGVHPKDLWGRVQRKRLRIFNVAYVLGGETANYVIIRKGTESNGPYCKAPIQILQRSLIWKTVVLVIVSQKRHRRARKTTEEDHQENDGWEHLP